MFTTFGMIERPSTFSQRTVTVLLILCVLSDSLGSEGTQSLRPLHSTDLNGAAAFLWCGTIQ